MSARPLPAAPSDLQLRFPAVLRIVDEQPVEFQERIRKRFPKLEIERGLTVEGSPILTEQPAPRVEPRIFRFRTSDDASAASLTADFVAISTTGYRHWPDFAEMLELTSDTLRGVYDPAYVRRLGLRYINRMTFENTGVSSSTELLSVVRESLTAVLNDSCWKKIPSMSNQLLLVAGENEKLSLRSTFESGERPAFLLDLDYFAEGEIPLAEVLPRCEKLSPDRLSCI